MTTDLNAFRSELRTYGRKAFLPTAMPGTVGSPVNPIATV
jgi:hypothetical protein